MKKCPTCGREIQDAAVKCKHCKSEIPVRSAQSSAEEINTTTSAKSTDPSPSAPTQAAQAPIEASAEDGDASAPKEPLRSAQQQAEPSGSVANKNLLGGLVSLGILVVGAWYVGKSYFECGVSVPAISVAEDFCKGLSFEKWVWDGHSLKARMTYKGGDYCGRIKFEAYDGEGVKLEESNCSHPSVKAGEAVELRCCCPSASSHK